MEKNQIKDLNQWAKGKPLGLVMGAEQLAISAEACFENMKLFKAGEKIEALSSMPKNREWVSLYRNHRKILRSAIERLRRYGKNGKLAAEIGEALFLEHRTLKKALQQFEKRNKKMTTAERRRIMSHGQKEVNRLYSFHLADIESDVKGKTDEEFDRKLIEALKEPEINFYLRAWIPCWLLYGEYPPLLLRRARLGDLSAMEKLLRLDTRVLDDTKIGEYFHQAKEQGKKATADRLIEALRKEPKRKITIKRVKYSIVGLISLISIVLRHKLTEPEIKNLFDAAARDMGRDNIDTDLPETPQAFARAILRERTFWMPTISPTRQKII